MPGLSLFAAPPQLLNAALLAMAPLPVPAPVPALSVAAITWSPAAQDTDPQPSAPPAGGEEGPPEGDNQGDADAGDADADEQGNEIIIEGSYGPPAIDPVEKLNAESYRISQAVDQALVEPLAYAYRDGLPEPIRDGLGNVVRNLGEPSNALNFLLQGKVGKALGTLGRLAINSTIGIGGLIDVAGKPGIGLPYRRNGFANTLGYYGVGPGPYLYLPITGPTTVRDQIGITLDQALLPFLFGKPFNKPAYAVSYFAINGLDSRLRDDPELADIRDSDDPYAMRRETYLARRAREIAELKGEVIPEPAAEVEDTPPAPDETPPFSSLTLPERVQLTASDAPGGR